MKSSTLLGIFTIEFNVNKEFNDDQRNERKRIKIPRAAGKMQVNDRELSYEIERKEISILVSCKVRYLL